MPIDVQMPDGTIISGVPDNFSQADLLARYKAFTPPASPTGAVPDELGRYDVAKQPTEQPISSAQRPEDVGFIERNIGAAKRGVESLGDVASGLGLAGTAVTGTPEETAIKMRQIKQQQSKPPETPGTTVADIERIYKEKGLGAAAAQVPSFITESILSSAPQMAGPLAAGSAATALSAPLGPAAPLVGTLVGVGTYGVQQFGNFLTRQAQEKNDPKELEILKAAGTAAATAPLGYFADRFTAGLGGIGAKKAGAEILKELSARQAAAQVGKRVAVGATEGIIAEAPLEVLEQAAERYQAGLSLTGDDAKNEYKEAFFGAAGSGAGIGGTSRGISAYKDLTKPATKPEESGALTEDQQRSRWDQLNAIANGTPDQVVLDKDGKEVTIYGEQKRYFTPEEQAEYKSLKEKFAPQEAAPTAETPVAETPTAVSEQQAAEVAQAAPQVTQPGASEAQDIQAMLDEFQGKSPAVAQPVATAPVTPEIQAQAPVSAPAVEPVEAVQPTAQPAPEPVVQPEALVEPLQEPTTEPIKEEIKPETPLAGEPVQEPEKITTPATGWGEAQTGKPITVEMYQGRGEDKSKIYNGVEIPVAGPAQYFAPTGEDAAKYGQVTKHNVTLNNPLVIKNDAEWRALTKDKAGWRFPNPFGLKPEEVTVAAQSLKDAVMAAGHDGLIIKPSMQGDDAKTLWNVFGHDQAVVYSKPEAKTQEKPAEEAKPTPPVQTREFDITKSKEQINSEIDGMTGDQLSQWMVDNAPNEPAKHIAEKILARVKEFDKVGIPVKIDIPQGWRRDKGAYGKQKPVVVNKKLQYFSVVLNGLNNNNKADEYTGTDYATIMHEMLHMVSALQLHIIKRNLYKGDKTIYKDLLSIRQAIGKRINEELSKPKEDRDPVVRRHLKTWLDIESVTNGAIKYGDNSYDELFAYGLTEPKFQEFLASIKMGKQTVLSKLMDAFRKLIGVDAKYQTALDKLAGVADKFFEEKPADVAKILGKVGWSMKELQETRSAIAPTEGRNYKGEPVQASWTMPEDSVKHWYGLSDQQVDDLLYKLQDKQVDTKRVQQAIEKAGIDIADNLDVYEKEQLYHGRTATGIREYLLNELLPAIKELKNLGLTPQDLKEYLHNRHAKERNDKMNEKNRLDPVTGEERKTPWELQDRASGISTADAQKYMKGLDPAKKAALDKVANRFDAMVKETQQILVDSGAEDQATIDAWNDTYEHYVPLFRLEDDFAKAGGMGATGSSKGFGTRGSFSKRAMGSEKEVQDILGNMIAQRERALIRAEKMKVGHALYGLTLHNPNSDIYLPVNPDAIKSKEALIKELQDMGYEDAESIANNLMEEPKSRYISKEKKQFIDPNTGLPTQVTEESVRLKVDNLKRFGDNVFPVRINGKDRYIFFNKNNPQAMRMVQSLLNLDADSLGDIEGMIGRATRWFASVNTQYNPIFGAVNLIRDVGGANFNLTSTPIAGEQVKVTKGIFPAMRGILNVLRDERKGKTDTTGKWAKAFQEFRKEGGQTGYRDSLIRTDEEKQIVEREMEKIKPGGNVKKAFGAVMGALSDFNDMMENSVRVSAYVAARDKGLSPQKAAIVAKNLTVNFDKKGQLSARINAYYAFFNASMQGTARLAQTLKGPMGKKIIAGGIGLGTMQAVLLAMAGFRDDEPPEFVKERNFVIPTPDGKYLTIPYPLGLHILPNFGRITTEFVLGGGKNAGKKVANLTGAFMDAFSPIGSSGLSIQSVLPTVLDPVAALETNKDAFGRPIYKEDRATNPTPGYLRSRESASEISKGLSYFLNLASGGGKYSKGFLSPTADELDYIAGQVTGGAGRELMKAEQAIKAGVTGEDLPAYRVPLLGRFYGETESNAAESSRFYNNITKMADYENEVKGRIKNKENVGEYLRENPQARYWQTANTVENQINALNKQKKEFIDRGLPKDRIKRIENQKATIMKRFNDQMAKYED